MNIDFIKRIKLPAIAKRHPVAFSVAVVLHIIVFFGLFFSNVQHWEEVQKKPTTKAVPKFIPKTVTIDLNEIKKEQQRLIDGQKKKQKKLKREERRLRELEDKRYQKQRKINKLKAKAKKERQARDLAEKKRKTAEEKTKIAEKKRKTAEEKAKIEEKKRQEIEKKRLTESKKFKAEQKKRASTQQQQLAVDKKRKDAQENILNELKVKYTNQIAARVRENWRYSGAKDEWGCVVNISQDNNGNVKDVKLKSCNVDNKSKEKYFKNAIIRAVRKASPLPSAPDKSVFDHEIIFHFKVN
ncbi:TolA protein [Bathymodiolus heckerae thiotrophic gill symbiont]|uniref:cell envelope integrity protein TolA n=1 Tax=Bathymodiolus heckerae thiotrophic gill symbiont TaxID=1052212 RepID=UPI0010B1654F|nr:cell envelope integrity protein TolA [Bathymodiolus heckerae thiotrophic gill symbiont]SMN12767.1 TolA protein [Bathymodiolus heckerae thiotrophic gill symbiont]